MSERERICLFAGTTEGRQLARILAPAAELTVCVATEYGEILLDGIAGIEVRAGRMDEGEMASFFHQQCFSRILDATHPYAALVTENIQAAAKEAGIPVLRILRETDREIPDAVYVNSVEEARDWLAAREGNVFLTTGSKELGSYIGLDWERVWARVLPTAAALEACAQAGIPSSHVIAAQGPFSEEINLAEMKSIGARYLVTKASGKAGGFDEKIRAARTAGVTPVIIGRPAQIEGLTLADALRELGKTLPLRKTAVKIVGIGPGAEDAMTARAREAVRTGDLLLGAKSVVGSLGAGRETVFAYTPDKILEALES
ncbi:MAG: precorrin-6A reductase, partial [Clostridia bacterium]|nr:precorrin-6A reductase [Clostridia bacterium]